MFDTRVDSLIRDLRNLYTRFCYKVRCALGISATGDPNLVLNQQGNWITSGSGGSQSLNQVLNVGNETLGIDEILTAGDRVVVGDNRAGVGKGTTDMGGDKGVSEFCANGFEKNFQAGKVYLRDEPSQNIVSIREYYGDVPDATFDSTQKFQVGSIIEFVNGTTYICIDATTNAAIWKKINIPFPSSKVVIVTADRDLEANDVGAVLFNPTGTQAVTLTMPNPSPFSDGDLVAFVTDYNDSKIQMEDGGRYFKPFSSENNGGSSEIVIFAFSNITNKLNPYCGSITIDTTIEKSPTRNLYDNENNHGTATLTSGTVTVNNANIKTGNEIFVTLNTPSGTVGHIYAAAADIIDGTSFIINSTEAGDNSSVNWKF